MLAGGEGPGEGLDQLLAVVSGVVGAGGRRHGEHLEALADRLGDPLRLHAEQVPHVLVEVLQRAHLARGGLVAQQRQGERGGDAAADLGEHRPGLADRQAVGLHVPLLVVTDPLAHGHVHDPHLHRGGPPGRAGGEQRAGLRDVDPEPAGLEEAAQGVVTGIAARQRQGSGDAGLGVDLEGDRAGDGEEHRAPAAPDRGAELDHVAVDPVGDGVELGEHCAHRLRRVGHGVDPVAQRLVEHLAPAAVADLAEEHVGDEPLRDGVAGVVVVAQHPGLLLGGEELVAEAGGELLQPGPRRLLLALPVAEVAGTAPFAVGIARAGCHRLLGRHASSVARSECSIPYGMVRMSGKMGT